MLLGDINAVLPPEDQLHRASLLVVAAVLVQQRVPFLVP